MEQALPEVAAVVLIEFLVRKSRLNADAATGVAFTSLFALGVLLIRKFANRAHLDVDCVLFGHLELTLFDTVRTPFGAIPESVVQMGIICLVVGTLVWLFYKELVITSFDPSLARCLGLRVNLIHYGLMTATSLVIVASMEAVGAVLVVGMLIVAARNRPPIDPATSCNVGTHGCIRCHWHIGWSLPRHLAQNAIGGLHDGHVCDGVFPRLDRRSNRKTTIQLGT